MLFPAIDLRGHKVVRLAQGDYARETVYGGNPVTVALEFQRAGAEWVHVVDLDAAKQQGSNRDLVAAVANAVKVPVQTGGGVRTMTDVEALIDAGARRLVIGTAAFRTPGFVAEAAAAYPGQIAVDIATAGGKVAVHGWTETTEETLAEACRRFADVGAAAFVVTSVERDGMLTGPDTEGLRTALAASAVPVVASGGVGSVHDLRTLAGLDVNGRRLEGAIVGRAIYEGRVDVAGGVAALRVR